MGAVLSRTLGGQAAKQPTGTSDQSNLRETVDVLQNAADVYLQSGSIASHKELLTQIRRVQLAALKPQDSVFQFRLQLIENAAVLMLVEMGVMSTLSAKQGTAMSANELAKATGFDELLIGRLMRVACALLFCEEKGEGLYQANQFTEILASPGWKGGFRWANPFYKMTGEIYQFVDKIREGSPESKRTAYEFSNGGTIWDVLKTDPEQRMNFDLFMRERQKHDESVWHKHVPAITNLDEAALKTDPKAALFVDVGGANGSQVLDFRTLLPNLPGRCILQDLHGSQFIERLGEANVEAMDYDFFTPQPVKGARFYYFRNVFHNWSDGEAVKILRNLASAMEPGYSTLLIHDYVLPSQNAQLRGGVEDILMMLICNALERTSKQYEALLTADPAFGFEIVGITYLNYSEEAVIEVRKTK